MHKNQYVISCYSPFKSGVFSWSEEADNAWQQIKALIMLDIKLVIPKNDEQLILTTDASKVAMSAILWVVRDGDLRVVGCYSKLFSQPDVSKSIFFLCISRGI